MSITQIKWGMWTGGFLIGFAVRGFLAAAHIF